MRILATAAVVLLGFWLAACGGSGDDSSTASTAAPPTSATTTSAPQPEGGATGAGGSGSGKHSAPAGKGPGSHPAAPASLRTDPGSISGAIVTSTGAVQTLPPNAAEQARAMENSYQSIKEFGAEASGSEATDITFALVQYLTAKAARDSATACARLYSPLREDLVKFGQKSRDPAVSEGGCRAAYDELMKRSPQAAGTAAAKIDVASVRSGEGNRAFVVFKTPDTLSADMPMYLEDGVWTVGALEAYVLTAAQLRSQE